MPLAVPLWHKGAFVHAIDSFMEATISHIINYGGSIVFKTTETPPL